MVRHTNFLTRSLSVNQKTTDFSPWMNGLLVQDSASQAVKQVPRVSTRGASFNLLTTRMKNIFSNKKGFTFIEIVTVVAILGITITMFYTVLVMNNDALNNYITRSDLWLEMDRIVDSMTLDGRDSQQINVDNNNTSVTFVNNQGNVAAVYNINNDGTLTVNRAGNVQVLTRSVNLANSSFSASGRALVITLALSEQLFSRQVDIATSTEIFPRNTP